MSESPFMRVRDAADWAQTSLSEMYKLIHAGEIEARCHGRGQKGIRVVRASLEAWSLARTVYRVPASPSKFQRAKERLRSFKTEGTDPIPAPLQKGVG